jgi:hypothetical protein
MLVPGIVLQHAEQLPLWCSLDYGVPAFVTAYSLLLADGIPEKWMSCALDAVATVYKHAAAALLHSHIPEDSIPQVLTQLSEVVC